MRRVSFSTARVSATTVGKNFLPRKSTARSIYFPNEKKHSSGKKGENHEKTNEKVLDAITFASRSALAHRVYVYTFIKARRHAGPWYVPHIDTCSGMESEPGAREEWPAYIGVIPRWITLGQVMLSRVVFGFEISSGLQIGDFHTCVLMSSAR